MSVLSRLDGLNSLFYLHGFFFLSFLLETFIPYSCIIKAEHSQKELCTR